MYHNRHIMKRHDFNHHRGTKYNDCYCHVYVTRHTGSQCGSVTWLVCCAPSVTLACYPKSHTAVALCNFYSM